MHGGAELCNPANATLPNVTDSRFPAIRGELVAGSAGCPPARAGRSGNQLPLFVTLIIFTRKYPDHKYTLILKGGRIVHITPKKGREPRRDPCGNLSAGIVLCLLLWMAAEQRRVSRCPYPALTKRASRVHPIITTSSFRRSTRRRN